MSTFNGKIPEFPGISIDQFEGINVKSTIFFLSHVHTDHMRGLQDETFLNNLKTNKLKLYTHEVSWKYLRSRFEDFKDSFQYLCINAPTTLRCNDFEFTVTLLPAGHCPGSVMFLFESDQHTILYTGDFRLQLAEFKKFKGLYNSQGMLKCINKVHLDTTFMFRRYEEFPSREQSLNAICHLISEWLDKSHLNVVNLQTPYYYGAEFILTQVYERFNMPVHVWQGSYKEFYKYFPNMDKCITLSSDARIHSNCQGYKLFCNANFNIGQEKILTIVITAMFWEDWREGMDVFKEIYRNTVRVCYSTHASCREIREIMNFLKPEQIEANVEPKEEDACDLEEILELIDDCTISKSPIKRSPVKKIAQSCKLDDRHEKTLNNDCNLKKSEKIPCVLDVSSDDDDEYKKLQAVRAKKAKKSLNYLKENCSNNGMTSDKIDFSLFD